MDGGSLRRRDTTKGTPLRILSLDGGGVRGFSMLILLRDFMHKVYTEIHDGEPPEEHYIPKPCEYFDLIAGTGTGGLIAIMLGRLRMNTKDCMDVYVQMTRKVFETDKTIIGIPYRSTLFKASMLEEAIKSCVRTFEHEKGEEMEETSMPMTPASFTSDKNGMPINRSPTSTTSSRRYSGFSSDAYSSMGNSGAALQDPRRERRCKTAVTAVLKGHSERTGTNILLRSYPSRTQPAVESECTIWQAGRATCATKLAFKEIRIGTSTFQDEGYGLTNSDKTPTYNPAPQILDEAILNEWPGQSVGLLLSIGTGKRPGTSHNMQSEWWEGFAGGLGSFAEAKRKLIAKIEGCEKTHREMLSIHLPKRSVNPDNYLRLNVEVGVGEFGMNEWNRLAEISNSTLSYLNTPSVKDMLDNGAGEMAKVEAMRQASAAKIARANESYNQHHHQQQHPSPQSQQHPAYRQDPHHHHQQQQQQQHLADPYAIELPATSPTPSPLLPRPLSRPGPQYPAPQRPLTYPSQASPPNNDEKYTIIPPPSYPPSTSIPDGPIPLDDEDTPPYRASNEYTDAPPLPPKTPIPHSAQTPPPRRYHSNPTGALPPQARQHHHPGAQTNPPPHMPLPLPYPDSDGPPPAVDMARKPGGYGNNTQR